MLHILLGSEPFAFLRDGRAIASLPCNQAFVVSDSGHYSPPATVTFHDNYAQVAFEDSTQELRTLFVYVDGLPVALISARGPVTIVAPLDSSHHHKVVSGTTISGVAIAGASSCT